MREKIKGRRGFCVGLALICFLIIAPVAAAERVLREQQANTQGALSAQDKQALAAFEKRVKEYVKLREQIEAKMPKLSKDSTPEQIQSHETALAEKVKAARSSAQPGQIFTPDIAAHFRALIRSEYKGQERKELRQTVLEADTKGVPLRVNHAYPESKELVEMPPTLLLKLPQLPKQLRYRFVNRNMLLVDRESNLIIDYLLDAVP